MTHNRFCREKYTIGENLSLVENTGNSKVISVNYNPQFYHWQIHHVTVFDTEEK